MLTTTPATLSMKGPRKKCKRVRKRLLLGRNCAPENRRDLSGRLRITQSRTPEHTPPLHDALPISRYHSTKRFWLKETKKRMRDLVDSSRVPTFWLPPELKKICVARELNPDLQLGRQQC